MATKTAAEMMANFMKMMMTMVTNNEDKDNDVRKQQHRWRQQRWWKFMLEILEIVRQRTEPTSARRQTSHID